MSKSKFWCFTINNPEEESLEQWKDVIYRVHQLEKGENETPHFQGFVIFSGRKSLTQLKKINPRAHWERTKGTPDEARNYCMKEDTRIKGPWECGERWEEVKKHIGAGKRNDLSEIQEKIEKGASLREIYKDHFNSSAQYYKFFERYKFMKDYEEAQEERNVKVILYWGVSGAGKTYRAFKGNPGCYILRKGNAQNLWFPGYTGQKTIVFDDFDGSWMGITNLLRLLDIYPLHVEDKGSSTPAMWTKVIITSNQPIEEWYPEAYQKCPERLEAVKRRIHEIVYFDKKWTPGPLDEFALVQNSTENRDSKNPEESAVILDTGHRCLGNTISTCVQKNDENYFKKLDFPENSMNLNNSVDDFSQWNNLVRSLDGNPPKHLLPFLFDTLNLDKHDMPPASN